MSLKRCSNTCFLAKTVQIETQMVLPDMIRSHSMTCCHAVISLKFTVFSPASVMAEVTKNRLST